MDNYTQDLRCQDVNAGLRTFDAASAVLTPVKKTRLVGVVLRRQPGRRRCVATAGRARPLAVPDRGAA
jgi:hypothetical protein